MVIAEIITKTFRCYFDALCTSLRRDALLLDTAYHPIL